MPASFPVGRQLPERERARLRQHGPHPGEEVAVICLPHNPPIRANCGTSAPCVLWIQMFPWVEGLRDRSYYLRFNLCCWRSCACAIRCFSSSVSAFKGGTEVGQPSSSKAT